MRIVIVHIGEGLSEVEMVGADEVAGLLGNKLLLADLDPEPALFLDNFFSFLVGSGLIHLKVSKGLNFLNDELEGHSLNNKLIKQ